MDIEGSEIQALDGAKETLLKNNLNIAIASYHIVNGEKTCIALEKKLKSLGYETHTGYSQHLTTYGWKL